MNKRHLILPLALLASACQPSADNNSTFSTIAPINIDQQSSDYGAHWIDAQTMLLANSDVNGKYALATITGKGQQNIKLVPKAMPQWIKDKHPHLAEFKAFEVTASLDMIKQWLKQPLFIYDSNTNAEQVSVSRVQIGEVIDDLYTSNENDANEIADFGATVGKNQISIKLWAPTANNVSVKLFNQDKSLDKTLAMTEDTNSGVWHLDLPKATVGKFYQYQIDVFHPATLQVETITTTDPYSLSLSTNSKHSQIISLDDASTQPQGWSEQALPELSAPEDAILYEVHVRDFSATDQQLSNEAHRGKFKAFTETNSSGMQHLQTLKSAGLNHIHLLPAFDIGTVNEEIDKAFDLNSTLTDICQSQPSISICIKELDGTMSLAQVLESFDPKTDDAQALVTELKTVDKYNWGYDPFHYTVPEGSYAVNPDGSARIVEFREMVQHLHNLGFRVIMDVVYNHTHQARLEPTAVLDKIVPNYYQRLHPISGLIEQSTCCDNTATERVMMEKLMIDSLVVWARDYKIDGFRFDLMGHQPKDAMLRAREAVRAFDPDTYFYGEGWNFGEVANNRQFVQASQLELGGTEIGTFTDRLRDAVRGPGISVQGDDIRRNQGIGNGLATAPNELNKGNTANAPDYLLLMDQLRIGLIGNLANFPITDRLDNQVTGKDVPYGSQPTGYALDPADTINYVSKHDNQSLWDNNQYRNAIELTTEQRVRLHNQSLSYAILAQGIPFIHMGSELLRSKSYLRDSYDYSDWFNRVDFNKQQNYYHVGLPPAEKDHANWPLISYLIEQNKGRDIPSSEDIQFASRIFNEFLAIRSTSPLFKMTSAEQITKRIKFLNTGSNQQQGLIAMHIKDNQTERQLDKKFSEVLVFFNSSPNKQTFSVKNAARFTLHPVQANGIDTQTKLSTNNAGQFSIPAFTTAVFIKERT
ncbi:pullulanase-type alpha-1,6-glucosidase [Thalassotalea sp. M1531]|uniref:Pullulanase-type alpha-1,6-glucosidase n=1 Tax=Thalassotalea algicola TaxID=2716224 RepID=A0A7Y0L9E0_9GAMM|nr:pullulanase-type alpha-1,6-glucosidase [Thalassotalea algicola]NMP30008.1 pullulanase-type alpha-1,6-glucosidase [Thalassotalea algicola]